MNIIKNSRYFFAIPKSSKGKIDLIEKLVREKYKNKLKFARMCKTNKKLEHSILTKRTI